MAKYDTKLSAKEEDAFKQWKSSFAPKDSGFDYDLRGAFKAGIIPNPETGHWPDTFKKPNHPTFSNESIYAAKAPTKAGRWIGDTFVPPIKQEKIMARKDEQRKKSFFPSIDSRFMGALEPSPRMGSYYNPAKYANQGFSHSELSRIQGLLSNAYEQDLKYNRVANPRYQTEQDTGYSSNAQFGSGRASAATTRNYINKYGAATPDGNISFMTPSGGSISFSPRNRGRAVSPQAYLGMNQQSGAQPTTGPFTDITGPLDIAAAKAKGYGQLSPTIQSGAGGLYSNSGGVMNPIGNQNPVSSFFSGVSNLFQGAQQGLANIGASIGKQFSRPQMNQQPMYAGQPRRYFDEP